MDLQGWDPGDQRLLRDNWKECFSGSSKESLEFRKVLYYKAGRIRGIFNLVPVKGVLFTHLSTTRSLWYRILVLIKTRSQDLSGLRFNGCRTDIIRSVLLGKWRHMRRSRVLMSSRRWDSGVGGGFWWGLVDWQSENQGVVEWRLPSNLRGVDLVIEKGNFGKLLGLNVCRWCLLGGRFGMFGETLVEPWISGLQDPPPSNLSPISIATTSQSPLASSFDAIAHQLQKSSIPAEIPSAVAPSQLIAPFQLFPSRQTLT
ncbi:hypothetical protein F2Q68_00019754 [Brassica cretica]|uniref:Uncharacterized protein n=1 Tax=Brassica cretica TaxID=69181 RepID=A0A8S9G4H7_BRACR|nr:hypothetical protein F2Q68_00019754 [Brassica cretica]